MKHIIFLVAIYISINACAQSVISVEQINVIRSETMQDTSKYKKKVFTRILEEGISDTTIFYLKDNQVKYIYYHKYTGGLTSVDDHFYEELVYAEDKLVFIRWLLRWDHFDKGFTNDSKTKVEESLIYLDNDGQCLKYYNYREATGTRLTVMDELKKIPLKEKDCLYCAIDGRYGDKYLKKIK